MIRSVLAFQPRLRRFSLARGVASSSVYVWGNGNNGQLGLGELKKEGESTQSLIEICLALLNYSRSL
jgi:hypothetical protein